MVTTDIKAIQAVFHGMQVTCSPEDWPNVRIALLEQATVWEVSGKIDAATRARTEVNRIDQSSPTMNIIGNGFIDSPTFTE